MLRATWFIKVMYLNQIRPASIGMAAGGVDKSQTKRLDLWTKDFLEYAQSLLDEVFQNGGAATGSCGMSSQGGESAQGHSDAAELDMHAKWRYIMRLLQWHCAEGLLARSQVVDWALRQIQEKDSVDALELLLPVVLDSIDSICMSQTHVRIVVDMSLHWLRKLCSPSGALPKTNARPFLLHISNCLIELFRYLLVVVPDTFVSIDCFPLPHVVCSARNGLCLDSAQEEDISKNLEESKSSLIAAGSVSANDITVSDIKCLIDVHSVRKSLDSVLPQREVVIKETVALIQKRAATLAKVVSPDILRSNEGSVVQGLDNALISGDIVKAYSCLFDGNFCSQEQLLRSEAGVGGHDLPTLFSANVNASEFRAVQFLCEWATCSFRDNRKTPRTVDKKPIAGKDMSRVYMAVSILRLADKKGSILSTGSSSGHSSKSQACVVLNDSHLGVDIKRLNHRVVNEHMRSEYLLSGSKVSSASDCFLRADPLHDLIAAWIDHHELHKNQGFDRFLLLLTELVNEGLFRPDAYVRRLILDGILERKTSETDIKRAAKHRRILRHLPGPPFLSVDVSKDSDPLVLEAARQYQNERRLALIGVGGNRSYRKQRNNHRGSLDAALYSDARREPSAQVELEDAHDEGTLFGTVSDSKKQLEVRRLKQALCRLLQLPNSCLGQQVKTVENKANGGIKNLKRHSGSSSVDKWTATPGCEECIRKKRQKVNEEKGWASPGSLAISMEQEDTWWLKKGSKIVNVVKLEPPVKPPKQTIRGRPKTVRKTQSLAQLANPRIDGSQGASPLQASDNKVACPYHQFTLTGNSTVEPNDNSRISNGSDLRAIGAAIKHLRLVEKRTLSSWLVSVVHDLVGGENRSQGVQKDSGSIGLQYGSDGGSSVQWRLNEEHFITIVYVLDLSLDFRSILKLLLWLLPLAAISAGSFTAQSSRNTSGLVSMKENSSCDVSEATILSCLRRYENILTASNLLPHALSAGMQRASNVMSAMPGGRAVCSLLLGYVRDLLRKYGGFASVQTWEKDWRRTCDQRLGAELDALKAGDSEGGFNLIGLTNSGVGDDRDDPPPQKLSGRLSRVGASMKDIVQRGLNEVILQIISRDKDLSTSNSSNDVCTDRIEESHFSAQRVVSGLMDSIRQNGGGVPQADSILISAAVAAIVNHAATAAVNVFEASNIASNFVGPGSVVGPFVRCARRVMQIHVDCLRLLKEALGERHSRTLEAAVASEAFIIVSSALGLAPGRAPRAQFHMSPETPETTSAFATSDGSTSNSTALGRATTAAAAVACLVIFCVLQGIASLERVVMALRLKDGLEALHLPKHPLSNSNGISRTVVTGSTLKVDNVAEAHVYWFRVLIGDCRHVAGGLVADLLGDANIRAFARLQSLMPLTTVFSPMYAIFSAAIRRQQILYITTSSREDPILYTLVPALNDVFSHDPFRDVCFRNTRELHHLLSSAVGDSEYASLLDVQLISNISKAEALVPLCAKLFLHALLDRELPACLQIQDIDSWLHGQGDKSSPLHEKPKMEQLVKILDELQPATFHWQWVELRLLLNELVLIEKIEVQNMPAVEAVQAVAACSDVSQLSECENFFTLLVLTRLLVRPEAAPLYSEAVHCLGKALEESLIVHVKWILDGPDMLLGRKSLGQLLEAYANSKGYSVSTKHLKSWEPQHVQEQEKLACGEFQRKQAEAASPEEGEFSEEAFDLRKREPKEINVDTFVSEDAFNNFSQFATEKALADLVLPCLKRSSSDTCNGFAVGLVKQLSNLEQQITLLTRTYGKPNAVHNSVSEALTGKGQSSRRSGKSGLEGGSPGIGRKPLGSIAESSPLSAAALQNSMWLRLQFLLPLLPIIYSDRESTAQNMRLTLAPVLLRLLGTRIVQEAEEQFSLVHWKRSFSSKDFEWKAEAASASASALAEEGLFDRLLSCLHALLSGSWAVWLKPPSSGKSSTKHPREVPPFEKEAAERLQVELDHMQLPNSVRQRLQAAMPYFPPGLTPTVSAGPPQLHSAPVPSTQSGSSLYGMSISTIGTSQKQSPMLDNLIGKVKTPPFQERELELDPWTLLEDGTCSLGLGSGNVGGTSTETGNVRACPWLKGAVRVRRTNMTYVGAVDDT
ncbi:hypothetical protein O6H91_15G058800 [Diphasiastrum complanatum]|nr:hypothetical protein O6H91_15G058800 [Diphasiastrum complanatum]